MKKIVLSLFFLCLFSAGYSQHDYSSDKKGFHPTKCIPCYPHDRSVVYATAIQPDEKIIVGGEFYK